MQVEVTVLTQRGSARIRRSERMSADSLRFGRGTDNEVLLDDLRVPLAAAVLNRRPEGLFIEQTGDLPLRVNGASAGNARVRPGDEIAIGPFRIVLSEPPEGLDAALSVELVQPLGDALERILRHSRIGLEQTHLSKRRASWALFIVLILLCLAAPIAAYLVGRPATGPISVAGGGGAGRTLQAAWNPGELSNAHRYFADQCSTCHRTPFTEVKDAACLTCHRGIGSHMPTPIAPSLTAIHADLGSKRCADCHVEHRGLRSLVIQQGSLCVGCHGALAEMTAAAGVLDVRGFPAGHPQFRVTVVRDPAAKSLARLPLDATPKPMDRPGLVFSHAAHLVAQGFPKLDINPLVCKQCHVPEPSGQGFLPITYKGQCQDCHLLKFDIDLPRKTVPHGDDEGIANAVEGFYASLVLKQGVPSPRPMQDLERRLPNSAPAPQPALPPAPRDWVAEKTKSTLAVIFDRKRGCFECHVAGDPSRGSFRVAPVRMLTRFLPMARFDHAKHAALACEDCHAARQSQSSADVLIPPLQRCTTCHGGEAATFKAESTCISCHIFHRQQFGPMRQAGGPRK